MAFTFIPETGAGVPGANSYCDLQVAIDYHDAQANPCAAWTGAAELQRQKALVNATTLIGAYFSFPGKITHEAQTLYWPRQGVRRSGQWYYGETEIPLILQHATAHLAGEILTADPLTDDGREGIQSFGLGRGALEVTFTPGESKTIAKIVAAMLRPISTWMESTSRYVPLRRV